MPFDDPQPEWGGDDDAPMSDYLITANAFLIGLQSGLDWFALHEIFMASRNALAFEASCICEVKRILNTEGNQNG